MRMLRQATFAMAVQRRLFVLLLFTGLALTAPNDANNDGFSSTEVATFPLISVEGSKGLRTDNAQVNDESLDPFPKTKMAEAQGRVGPAYAESYDPQPPGNAVKSRVYTSTFKPHSLAHGSQGAPWHPPHTYEASPTQTSGASNTNAYVPVSENQPAQSPALTLTPGPIHSTGSNPDHKQVSKEQIYNSAPGSQPIYASALDVRPNHELAPQVQSSYHALLQGQLDYKKKPQTSSDYDSAPQAQSWYELLPQALPKYGPGLYVQSSYQKDPQTSYNRGPALQVQSGYGSSPQASFNYGLGPQAQFGYGPLPKASSNDKVALQGQPSYEKKPQILSNHGPAPQALSGFRLSPQVSSNFTTAPQGLLNYAEESQAWLNHSPVPEVQPGNGSSKYGPASQAQSEYAWSPQTSPNYGHTLHTQSGRQEIQQSSFNLQAQSNNGALLELSANQATNSPARSGYRAVPQASPNSGPALQLQSVYGARYGPVYETGSNYRPTSQQENYGTLSHTVLAYQSALQGHAQPAVSNYGADRQPQAVSGRASKIHPTSTPDIQIQGTYVRTPPTYYGYGPPSQTPRRYGLAYQSLPSYVYEQVNHAGAPKIYERPPQIGTQHSIDPMQGYLPTLQDHFQPTNTSKNVMEHSPQAGHVQAQPMLNFRGVNHAQSQSVHMVHPGSNQFIPIQSLIQSNYRQLKPVQGPQAGGVPSSSSDQLAQPTKFGGTPHDFHNSPIDDFIQTRHPYMDGKPHASEVTPRPSTAPFHLPIEHAVVTLEVPAPQQGYGTPRKVSYEPQAHTQNTDYTPPNEPDKQQNQKSDDNAPAESDEVLREMPQESPDQTSEETNTEGPGRTENQTRADDAKRDPPVSHSDQIEEHGDTKPDEKPRSKSRLASANDKSNRPAQTFHKSYEPPTEHNDTRSSEDSANKHKHIGLHSAEEIPEHLVYIMYVRQQAETQKEKLPTSPQDTINQS
ncbi:uncharacterized protein LOC111271682 isoform X2 [Varroa jacobsoni]|uniref:uncharacterized protein LOC111271682 isoform X2 n=1 Tax=Varroa jacobsoni TaxID=62625 RepID=UPI000BF6386E|nr:uncharacterized protein LOC111271682 isoform X2 [Varroa jacobsoni]